MRAEVGAVEGGKCKVVGGPNDGKEGTYTTDEDGKLWCDGPWGGTECTGGKCSDALLVPTIFDYYDLDGKQVFETVGLFRVGGRVVQFSGKVDATTGEVGESASLPVDVFDVADLRASKSKAGSLLADAIEADVAKRMESAR